MISALSRNDFQPMRADDASARFARKAALPSEVFDRLSAAARTEAFRIANVHKARLITRIRNRITRAIRDGEDWATVRQEILKLFAASRTEPPRIARLRQVFQQNVQQAYNDARREVLDDPDVTEAFPFRQYLTVGNGTPGVNNVRPEHAALHGLVLRWDDPFWDAHTPPWDYGCRCTMIALTAGQVKKRGLKVRDENFVRTRIRVPGRSERGIEANPNFVRGGLDTSAIDAEIRAALEEVLGE